MAVLTRAALLALVVLSWAGCYQPEVRDCTVSCAAPGDCASGQVCADGWCTAPANAGTCGAPPIDAEPQGSDAPDGVPPDAEPPDAAAAVLHVVVQGRGKVVIDPLGVECVGAQGTPGDCTFPVTPGSMQTLLPLQTHPQSPFAAWTTDNCSAQAEACVLTMEPPGVLVGARFGN